MIRLAQLSGSKYLTSYVSVMVIQLLSIKAAVCVVHKHLTSIAKIPVGHATGLSHYYL